MVKVFKDSYFRGGTGFKIEKGEAGKSLKPNIENLDGIFSLDLKPSPLLVDEAFLVKLSFHIKSFRFGVLVTVKF